MQDIQHRESDDIQHSRRSRGLHQEYGRRKASIKAVTSAEYEAEIKEIVEELGI